MRSRNDSPGLAVMRTTMRSESTLVPPVTAERSPPLSRITGADSPVIADSSTEAMPSIDLAVAGDELAGLDDDEVALAQRATPGPAPRAPSTSRRATVSLRILRSASAWALPRPSATASAKLAKRTVNQSQSVTATGEPERRRRSARCDEVAQPEQRGEDAADLDHEHDRVLAPRAAGASLRKLSTTAGARIARSKSESGLGFGA